MTLISKSFAMAVVVAVTLCIALAGPAQASQTIESFKRAP